LSRTSSGEGSIDGVISQALERGFVATPEGFENHPIGRAGAIDELGRIERRIGGDDRADTGFGALLDHGGPHGIGDRRGVRDRPAGRQWRRCGFGGARYGLLVAGATTEHAPQAERHEQKHHREDYNCGHQTSHTPILS
jgi:hypothetical protein